MSEYSHCSLNQLLNRPIPFRVGQAEVACPPEDVEPLLPGNLLVRILREGIDPFVPLLGIIEEIRQPGALFYRRSAPGVRIRVVGFHQEPLVFAPAQSQGSTLEMW